MRFLRQMWFHLKDYMSTPYFVQIVLVSTIAAALVQRLGVGAWSTDPYLGFARSGAIGLWTSCAAAAGIIGFERRKGTLAYLLSGSLSSLSTVGSVVSSTATFGLTAFPIALVVWVFPGKSTLDLPTLQQHLPSLLLGMFLLWFATLSITFVIAAVFILTPNAISYEGLILVPALALSGVFGSSSGLPFFTRATEFIIPSASATRILYSASLHGTGTAVHTTICLVCTALWMALSIVLGRKALFAARHRATIEVM